MDFVQHVADDREPLVGAVAGFLREPHRAPVGPAGPVVLVVRARRMPRHAERNPAHVHVEVVLAGGVTRAKETIRRANGTVVPRARITCQSRTKAQPPPPICDAYGPAKLLGVTRAFRTSDLRLSTWTVPWFVPFPAGEADMHGEVIDAHDRVIKRDLGKNENGARGTRRAWHLRS